MSETFVRAALWIVVATPGWAQAQAQDRGSIAQRHAPTAVETDNQYEPIRVGPDAAETPDEDGRFEMTLRGAYGRGVRLADASDTFALQLRARAQLRASILANHGPEDPGLAAEVRRLRLVLGGHALHRMLTYYIQLGFSANDLDDVEQVPLRDAFATLHLHRLFNLRVGQMKVPFDRQRVTSSSTLQFVDRAEVVRGLNLDRDLGFQIYSTDVLGSAGELSYQVGVFGGEGRNQFHPDLGLLYMARVQLGTPGFSDDFTESDLAGGRPRIALAAAVGYNHRARRRRSTTGPYYEDGFADFLHVATDVIFKARGFSFAFEGLLREDLAETISLPPASGWGLLVQVGYVFPLETLLELAARLALQRPVGDSMLTERSTVGGAFSWFAIGHDLKLQLDYHFTVETEEHLGRAQLQVYL